jgi:hypothetical protein
VAGAVDGDDFAVVEEPVEDSDGEARNVTTCAGLCRVPGRKSRGGFEDLVCPLELGVLPAQGRESRAFGGGQPVVALVMVGLVLQQVFAV